MATEYETGTRTLLSRGLYIPILPSRPNIDLLPALNRSFSLSLTGGLSLAFLMKSSGTSGLIGPVDEPVVSTPVPGGDNEVCRRAKVGESQSSVFRERDRRIGVMAGRGRDGFAGVEAPHVMGTGSS